MLLGFSFIVFLDVCLHKWLLQHFMKNHCLKISKTKFTYTVDDLSSSNIGVGISSQVNKFNFYAMVDNILEFSNLSSANNISLQFGFNLIFK